MKGKSALFLFGDIVVIEEDLIGVVLKTRERAGKGFYYDVYVRKFNAIKTYQESSIERYRVRHKYLNEEELMCQNS